MAIKKTQQRKRPTTKARHKKQAKAPKPRQQQAKPATTKAPVTKKDTVLALLRRDSGATLDELMATTGWQKHSVRGFLSGTIKKQLGLTIKRDGATYRIAG